MGRDAIITEYVPDDAVLPVRGDDRRMIGPLLMSPFEPVVKMSADLADLVIGEHAERQHVARAIIELQALRGGFLAGSRSRGKLQVSFEGRPFDCVG